MALPVAVFHSLRRKRTSGSRRGNDSLREAENICNTNSRSHRIKPCYARAMWFLAHRKGSTQVVPDGQTFIEECPTCQKRTRFVEVAITSKYGVFFVIDMIKDEERAFCCSACGDIFDLKDDAPAQAPAPTKPVVEVKPDREAVKRIEKKIDDELAELKKRMGR